VLLIIKDTGLGIKKTFAKEKPHTKCRVCERAIKKILLSFLV
jgi:hypothetical protein